MITMQKKITFDSFIRGILAALVVFCVLYLINKLSGVLLPFFIAWLIAYLLHPFVTFFQYKLKLKSRVLSIFTVMLLFLGIIALIFWGVVPPLIDEFAKVKNLISVYFIEGTKQADIPGTVANFIKEHIDMMKIEEALNFENVGHIIQKGVPQVWSFLAGSMNVIISIFASFIVLIYMFFILLDYENLSEGWIKFIPVKHRGITQQIFNDVKDGMNRYFRGQSLIALCVGILFSIGFLIIDFPLAIGFGLFIGLLNMVPYLQLIALIPTVLLALLKAADTGQNFWWILFLALMVFAVVQIIQDAVITPKVMGKAMGLNPAIILLSLSIWGSLMGIVGMIIALPATSLLISYYRRYVIKEADGEVLKPVLSENSVDEELPDAVEK
ncbi:MAG: AI-2E family transporter [Phocaeicola sp.]|nr:AI-2E family transporter [Phocaeicola sp.]